jgi:FkbM family methyltransferase
MIRKTVRRLLSESVRNSIEEWVGQHARQLGEFLHETGTSLIHWRDEKEWSSPLHRRSFSAKDSSFDCCIAHNEYGGYCIPLASLHRTAAQAVLKGQVYEPKTISFLIDSVRDGGDVIHAGTYFGDFLPALANHCANGAKVWAFEPNPISYRCANATISLNMADNVELRNSGLADINKDAALATRDHEGKDFGGKSTFVSSRNKDTHTVTCPLVRIDDIVPNERKVSAIHLDVEGFEEKALRGGISTIEKWLPVIVLENVPDDTWLEHNLLPLGYTKTATVHHNVIFSVDQVPSSS